MLSLIFNVVNQLKMYYYWNCEYIVEVKIMNEKIEFLRNNLEKSITECCNLTDSKVVMLSQELDKLIVNYQVCKSLIINCW